MLFSSQHLHLPYFVHAFGASSVDDGLAAVHIETVILAEMAGNLCHKVAVHVDQPSAVLTPQMDMGCTRLRRLILVVRTLSPTASSAGKLADSVFTDQHGEGAEDRCFPRCHVIGDLSCGKAAILVFHEKTEDLVPLFGFIDSLIHDKFL